MRDSLQEFTNEYLIDMPTNKKVNRVKKIAIEVDYGLVDKGVKVSENFVSVLFDGTFHS